MSPEIAAKYDIKAFEQLFFRIFKLIYWPICRAYAQLSMPRDMPAKRAMVFLVALPFWVVHRYWPRLGYPRSLSEKIFHRMLFDRNPLWSMLLDKLRVRDYVADRIGAEHLIPILWEGDRPEDIPFVELPLKFVVKTNHGCGYNILVKDKTQIDQRIITFKLKKWLCENFCRDKYFGIHWAYKNIRPKIMIEAFLDDNGKVPLDYKFFCYSGRAEFVQVSLDRFGNASEQILNRDFELINVYNGVKIFPGKIDRPQNYEEMIRVAESLARGLDFIRVDLYNLEGRVFFGELTCYPAGGIARFIPKEYDFIFGEKWEYHGLKTN